MSAPPKPSNAISISQSSSSSGLGGDSAPPHLSHATKDIKEILNNYKLTYKNDCSLDNSDSEDDAIDYDVIAGAVPKVKNTRKTVKEHPKFSWVRARASKKTLDTLLSATNGVELLTVDAKNIVKTYTGASMVISTFVVWDRKTNRLKLRATASGLLVNIPDEIKQKCDELGYDLVGYEEWQLHAEVHLAAYATTRSKRYIIIAMGVSFPICVKCTKFLTNDMKFFPATTQSSSQQLYARWQKLPDKLLQRATRCAHQYLPLTSISLPHNEDCFICRAIVGPASGAQQDIQSMDFDDGRGDEMPIAKQKDIHKPVAAAAGAATSAASSSTNGSSSSAAAASPSITRPAFSTPH